MPAEFQRAMDCILSEFPQAHAFIDKILVLTKGAEVDHIATIEKILKKLDKENISLKLTKCKFAQHQCEWLGHKITPTGITPFCENRTNRSAETAADSNAVEVVYGVNTQPPQVFASVGRIFRTITSAIK